MIFGKSKPEKSVSAPRFPGVRTATDGSGAVVAMETAAGEAAGAYPITPSTQMGEGWAAAVAAGKTNVNGRRLLFFEPEGEHAAAAVTTGMSLMGLRSTNFSSGQGVAYMHESLYAAVGKRLTYVLNVACRAMTKHALNVHAGHDDYHAIDDTGFFQLFAKDVQESADLNLISHRIAELALNPGICAQDGFLTSHVLETALLPEPELVKEYLGDPADIIDSPTPAQRLVFGEQRRRIPELFDLDTPTMMGVVQNQDSYAQGVAAQRPFYFDHIRELTDRAFDEYAKLTGRRYERAMGYLLDDAEYVLLGQGSVVANAEAVVDHLRKTSGLKIGVLNVTMFRPFPTDLIAQLLRGKRAVTVLERVDQPLAVDPPLLREIRAALGQAQENARSRGSVPHPGVTPCKPDEVPDFYSGCFGLGSRDLQPGDLVAAVRNMTDGGRRQFYLGIDFVRDATGRPKLQIWQEQLLEGYPHLRDLSLQPGDDLDLLPPGSTSIRIHSVGGWGAITMGKNIAVITADLLGLHLKANPKYGSEKKGQPTRFYASLSPEPIRLNCELKQVDVVLSPDPNAALHTNPLEGLRDGGVFVVQTELDDAGLWASLPQHLQRRIRRAGIHVHALDGFRIASEESSNAELRYRMQGVAFLGAFFAVAPLVKESGLGEDELFDGIARQLEKKFGHLGERVVEDNLRTIRRGYGEIRRLDVEGLSENGPEAAGAPLMPMALEGSRSCPAVASGGRFWEQVGSLYKVGEEGIADPFLALSAIPAATSSIRDMTDVRFEVPEFIADKCTGCGQCWVQCPDAAIPGVVNTVEEVLDTGIRAATNGRPLNRMKQATKPLARETHKVLKSSPFTTFSDALATAYSNVAGKIAPAPERRAELDQEFGAVATALADFPLARTGPFFDGPEAQAKGAGGLLSVTINPEACKGCNLCVEVCPDGALETVRQTDDVLARLRHNWDVWRGLPDTDDRYVNVSDVEEGIGVLSSLLLKKDTYRSMVGGDGACMGCGEKTAVHLVLSAVNALMAPRVAHHVEHLHRLIDELDAKARTLLASDADLARVLADPDALDVSPGKRDHLERINRMLTDLRDLHWRYTDGPTGKGRSTAAFANSTGCSSVWGSTYPYNPYPFPWVNHLFQDAPSIAVGIFEGHMRKMADGFAAVRKAELELAGEYDPAEHEKRFAHFDWHEFNDEEFDLCPPMFAVGGDGAMLDIGFQNLSRLMASGKPLRVIVLDTQVYSNTGGQACTSGFFGQVSDMAAYGKAHHGKEEVRKELTLIAMAHRGTYVLQSSQAAPSHLLGGVIQGLKSRRPAVFVLHCPCPPEHGIADDSAAHQARLALESRAFPLVVYDPDAGATPSECLSLEGNPSPEDEWPTYELRHMNGDGEETLELPLTIADWAATESRFRKHFRPLAGDTDDEPVPFHEFLRLDPADREGKVPFIHALGDDKRLTRVRVAPEIVVLAEDRLHLWHQLREFAGDEASESARDLVEESLGAEFERKFDALRAEYEAKLTTLRSEYPRAIARRMAEGLVRAISTGKSLDDLVGEAGDLPPVPVVVLDSPVATATSVAEPAKPGPQSEAGPALLPEEEDDDEDEDEDDFGLDAYIESERCTACNECTNLDRKLFVYNAAKQAVIKDPAGGPFKHLVMAAERCPVRIIHPGAPLNPKEKDLAKWVKRAEPFN